MSKQLAAKHRQGYDHSPVTDTCQNCADLESVLLEGRKQATHKCGIGGFVVKLGATCEEFSYRADGNE